VTRKGDLLPKRRQNELKGGFFLEEKIALLSATKRGILTLKIKFYSFKVSK
jgi:hypothetical protein